MREIFLEIHLEPCQKAGSWLPVKSCPAQFLDIMEREL